MFDRFSQKIPFRRRNSKSINEKQVLGTVGFNNLPRELHFELASYLSSKDKISISRVSTSIRQLYHPLTFKDVVILFKKYPPEIYTQLDPKYRVISFRVFKCSPPYKEFLHEEIVNILLFKPTSESFCSKNINFLDFCDLSRFKRLRTLKVSLNGSDVTQDEYLPKESLSLPLNVSLEFKINFWEFLYKVPKNQSFASAITYIELVSSRKNWIEAAVFPSLKPFKNLQRISIRPPQTLDNDTYKQIFDDLCTLPNLKSVSTTHPLNEYSTYKYVANLPTTLEHCEMIISGENYQMFTNESLPTTPLQPVSFPQVTHLTIMLERIGFYFVGIPGFFKMLRFGNALKQIHIQGDYTQSIFKELLPALPTGCLSSLSLQFFDCLRGYNNDNQILKNTNMFSNIKILVLDISFCSMDPFHGCLYINPKVATEVTKFFSPLTTTLKQKFLKEIMGRNNDSDPNFDPNENTDSTSATATYYTTQDWKLFDLVQKELKDVINFKNYGTAIIFLIYILSALPSTNVMERLFNGFSNFDDSSIEDRFNIYFGYYYFEVIMDSILRMESLEYLGIFHAHDVLSSPRFYSLVTDGPGNKCKNLKAVAFTEKFRRPPSFASSEHYLETFGPYLKEGSLPYLNYNTRYDYSDVNILDVEALRKRYVNINQSRRPSDLRIGASGSGRYFTGRKEKVNLDYYENKPNKTFRKSKNPREVFIPDAISPNFLENLQAQRVVYY